MHVIVVGGGAAGMMAAIAAARAGHDGKAAGKIRVTLLERNEKLGKKLFITGKGRCNVTNAGDMENLFDNVVTNAKFLYSAFYGFDNRARALKRLGAEICLHTRVKELWWEKPGPQESGTQNELLASDSSDARPEGEGKRRNARVGRIRGVLLEDGRRLEADRVILATGGLSYPSTGSTGDGYILAKAAGHDMIECRPSLVPFRIREEWCGELMGVSLRNVSLSLHSKGQEIYNGFGEMLFTHFGISGPLVLSASGYYVSKCRGEAGVTIDLKPALDEEQLDRRVLRDFEESKNRQFKNALGHLFPARLIPVMIRLSGIPPEKPVNEITRKERRAFVGLIKALPMTVTGVQGFAEAIITRGGVSVRDVNPSTMESRKIQGLYFAGELLDLDALTGGYNLQIAWSTGHLAGTSAAEEK